MNKPAKKNLGVFFLGGRGFLFCIHLGQAPRFGKGNRDRGGKLGRGGKKTGCFLPGGPGKTTPQPKNGGLEEKPWGAHKNLFFLGPSKQAGGCFSAPTPGGKRLPRGLSLGEGGAKKKKGPPPGGGGGGRGPGAKKKNSGPVLFSKGQRSGLGVGGPGGPGGDYGGAKKKMRETMAVPERGARVISPLGNQTPLFQGTPLGPQKKPFFAPPAGGQTQPRGGGVAFPPRGFKKKKPFCKTGEKNSRSKTPTFRGGDGGGTSCVWANLGATVQNLLKTPIIIRGDGGGQTRRIVQGGLGPGGPGGGTPLGGGGGTHRGRICGGMGGGPD